MKDSNTIQDPLPCYLLTGILGAGKTTLLNKILRSPEGRRLAVVVNEFGEVDVDGELVETSSGSQLTLANGCICCTIRDDLETSLIALLDENPDIEGLVIEASGVADPQPIANTFVLSPQLRHRVRLDSIVAVVDVEAFPLLRGQNAFLARRQVAAADLTLLNKVDLVKEEQLHSVETALDNWVPGLRSLKCTDANVPLELLLGHSRFRPEQLPEGKAVEVHVHAPGSGCHSHSSDQLVIQSWTFSEAGEFQARALGSILKKLPRGVYRAKGFVRLQHEEEELFQVQLCGTRLDIRPSSTSLQNLENRLVFLAEEGVLKPQELSERLREAMQPEERRSPSEELFEHVKRLLEQGPSEGSAVG